MAISLESDDLAEWGGTFENTVIAMAEDLLSDEEPVQIRLVRRGEEIRGSLTGFVDGDFVVSGCRIGTGTITGFYVD